ncbi:MAG: hypothetical protein WAP52_01135 [Candidatus Sungiibacteriota bacterium]
MTKNCRAALKATRKGDYAKAASFVEYKTADYFRVATAVMKMGGGNGFAVFHDAVIAARNRTESSRIMREEDRKDDVFMKVLMYASFLGGTFTVRDLTGGTGLKQQEVLEVLWGMMKECVASEQHGGEIVHNFAYFYHGPEFEEIGDGPKVYTIDFEYIERMRKFNVAIRLLEELVFGVESKKGEK